jgi:hypothetical protein
MEMNYMILARGLPFEHGCGTMFSVFSKKHMQHDKQQQPSEGAMPPAPTGNASNPSPREGMGPAGGNQLINEKGEKYLREVASPEDYPDARDEQEMDEKE